MIDLDEILRHFRREALKAFAIGALVALALGAAAYVIDTTLRNDALSRKAWSDTIKGPYDLYHKP